MTTIEYKNYKITTTIYTDIEDTTIWLWIDTESGENEHLETFDAKFHLVEEVVDYAKSLVDSW